MQTPVSAPDGGPSRDVQTSRQPGSRGAGERRVLIVKFGAIGDVVMAIPAAAEHDTAVRTVEIGQRRWSWLRRRACAVAAIVLFW